MFSNRQSGTSLIEVLIALVLVSILVNGALHLTTRATALHTEQQLLTMAIAQMQDALTNDDICTVDPVITLPNDVTITTTVFQGCATITVDIEGEPINIPTPVGLRANHASLGGEVVVGGTWSGS